MTIVKYILATVTLSFLATGAWSAEFTKGVVKKVDLKAKKVTVSHEELKSLDMPAMTAQLDTLAAGRASGDIFARGR